MTRWYRAYVGTCTDGKLGGVALRANVSKCVAIAVWHTILESAADANASGATAIDEFTIAGAIGEQLETVQRVLAALALANMFSEGQVIAWGKRQFESDSSTARTQKWRREHSGNVKDKESDADETSQERSCNDTVTVTSVSVSDFKKEEAFEKFWKVYPKRAGANPRKPAAEKFGRLSRGGTDPQRMIDGAAAYAGECERLKILGTEKVCTAIVFLNQERFNDYAPVKTPEQEAVINLDMAKRGYEWRDGKWSKLAEEMHASDDRPSAG